MKLTTTLFSLLLASFFTTLAAQSHLVTPADADIIITMRGQNLFDKVSLDEMKKIPAMNDMFSGLIQMTGERDTEVDELGIDLNGEASYFVNFQDTGDILMGMSFKVDDPETYKRVFMSEGTATNGSGVDLVIVDGFTRALQGNKGLITYSVISPSYEDQNSYDNYYYDDTETVEVEAWVEEPEEVYEEIEDAAEEVMEEEIVEIEEYIETYETEDEVIYEEIIEETMSYNEQMELELAKKNEEMGIISKAYALELMTTKSPKILDLNSKKIDASADFSILVNSYDGFYKFFNASTPSYYRSSMEVQMTEMMENIYSDFEWLSMNGYYDTDEFRIETNSQLSGDLADWYGGMLDAEFNSKMINYIPFNDHLGFMAASYNTEELLNGYYDYTKKILAAMPEMEEENIGETVSIAMDFVELFVDEKAIANLLKGDFYAGITDINTYDVEYTTYEYDDDWNYQEITKTKEEVRPDFLIMFSSDDQKNIDNIFKMIEISSRQEFKNYGDYYKISSSNNVPLDVYTMQKEGIVFIFTSQALFDFISKGGKKATAAQKSLVTDNSSIIQIDGSKLANKVPLTDIPADFKSTIEFLRDNAGNLSMQYGKLDNNMLTGEASISVKGNHENSLSYFMYLIEEMTKIQKNNSTYRN